MITESNPALSDSGSQPNPDEAAILIIRRHNGQSQSINAARDRCRVAIADNAERVEWLEKESAGAFADGTVEEMRETQRLLDDAKMHGKRLAALLDRLNEEFDRAKANEAEAEWHADKDAIDQLGAELEAMFQNQYGPAAEVIASVLETEAKYRVAAQCYNVKRFGVQDPNLRLAIPELRKLAICVPNTARGWSSYGDAIESLPGVATSDDSHPAAYWQSRRQG